MRTSSSRSIRETFGRLVASSAATWVEGEQRSQRAGAQLLHVRVAAAGDGVDGRSPEPGPALLEQLDAGHDRLIVVVPNAREGCRRGTLSGFLRVVAPAGAPETNRRL